jgi:Domain of unknown function (DUF4262)
VGEDDEIDRSVVEHGWHAIAIDDREPPFLYTCGLITQFQQPELVILGLTRKMAYSVVASIVEVIRNGTRLDAGSRVDLDGLVIAIGPFHPSQHELYLGYAMAHARRHATRLRALQVFWPDNDGRFPFDLTCDAEVRALQPRLELPASRSELGAFRREFGD